MLVFKVSLASFEAALERHDADEERQSQLLSENAELEDTLKVAACSQCI